MNIDLTVKINSLVFKNPVLTASGTSGYGIELSRLFHISKLGGLITKSVTLKPRMGNFPPRITETPCGMLNSIGLENKGIKYFLSEILPQIKRFKTVIIVSIAGETISEYAELAKILDGKVDALEVNISCPNVKKGGMIFGQDSSATEKVVRAVRESTSLPIIVKLTPNVARIEEFAKICEQNGADAVSLVNTYKGLAIDINTRSSKLGSFTGGVSGPAIKPLALYAVWIVAKNVRIPVVGCGGIMDWKDAIEFFMAGASLIEIGSATFRDPEAALLIIKGITSFLRKKKIENINKIVGVTNEN